MYLDMSTVTRLRTIMCGRFTLKNKDKIKEIYDIDIIPNYNVSPGSEVVVLASGPQIMKWTYTPSWAKTPINIINARIETLDEKPSFTESKRCIFLTDGWYEWKRWFDWKRRENNKTPYYHTIENTIIHMAGIYNSSGCAVVTEASKGELKNIHHRQPLLLNDEGIRLWLEGSTPEDNEIFKSINLYEVSTYVNSTKNNDKKCTEKK